MKTSWHRHVHPKREKAMKHVPELPEQSSSQRSWRGVPAPAVAHRTDAELSPEAVRLRQFLRDVLAVDYEIAMSAVSSYPHDEYYHYAAVLYDRYNWSRVKKCGYTTLASRSLDLSALSTHLILDRHVYAPALELGIEIQAIETTLMRYLHFADPVERTYISSIPGPRTEKGIEALIEKVVNDRTVVRSLFSTQQILQFFDQAMNRVVLDHFPAAHPLRHEIEAAVEVMKKAREEVVETQASSAQASHDTNADLPEYVRWLNWVGWLMHRRGAQEFCAHSNA